MRLAIDVLGERLLLSPGRALAWPRRRTLVIADPHWGKAAAFRAGGMPVPEVIAGDLARLDREIDDVGAERLVILGDCLHARRGREAEVFAAVASWRAARASLAVLLVRGNHDRRSGDPPEDWRFALVDNGVVEPPFVLHHEPGEQAAGYVLAGHLHPAVRLIDGAGSLRAPCFWFGARCGVLPAFGSFTGGFEVTPRRGDRVYAVGPSAVVEVRGRT